MVADVWPEKKSWSDGTGGLGGCARGPWRSEAGQRDVTDAGADRRRRRSSTEDVGSRPEEEGILGGNGGQGGVAGTSTELGG